MGGSSDIAHVQSFAKLMYKEYIGLWLIPWDTPSLILIRLITVSSD